MIPMMVLAILLFISLVFNGIVHKIYRPEHSANADQNHDYEVIDLMHNDVKREFVMLHEV